MTCVLIRKKRQRHRGECHVVTETEIGVVHLQANKCQDYQKLRESVEQILP